MTLEKDRRHIRTPTGTTLPKRMYEDQEKVYQYKYTGSYAQEHVQINPIARIGIWKIFVKIKMYATLFVTIITVFIVKIFKGLF